MKNIRVKWTVKNKPIPDGDQASHFLVGLGVTEVNEALTQREHVFVDVPPGDWAVWVVLMKADGTELAPPVHSNVVVPEDPAADVPDTITVEIATGP